MIYIAGTPLVDPSVVKIIKLTKNNTYHSLRRIWETVWLLPEKVHVTLANEFKLCRAKLLTSPGVTKCLNSWKFVTVSFLNYLLLWKIYVQKEIFLPVFTDSAYVCVDSTFYGMTLTLVSTWVRFPAKILLRCLKNIYLPFHLLIKSCLPGAQRRILLFSFNYKPSFLVLNNTFYPNTLFYIPWGSIILLLYCILS